MRPLSVYIHIPFCKSKCAYCDFASFAGKEALWGAYFRALWAEIDKAGAKCKEYAVQTVFFGGGTPSLVPAEYIAETLSRLRRALFVEPDAEISLEANPGTIAPGAPEMWKNAGINRLSIGVQSFDDALLKKIGRIHSAKEADHAVFLAREKGFQNINLDLIYALPGQSLASFEETLRHALSLAPTHISAYSLIVERGTPMEKMQAEIPNEEIALSMQRICTRLLRAHGFARYEISNYALEGYACRHNLVYWRRGEYLGFGLAAHAFFGGVRFENTADFSKYLQADAPQGVHTIPVREAMEETIMLSTRMAEGLDLSAFSREFGVSLPDARKDIIAALAKNGDLVLQNGRLMLTDRGMEVQNAIVLALLP